MRWRRRREPTLGASIRPKKELSCQTQRRPPVSVSFPTGIRPAAEPTGWVGWIAFAGTMMVMVGILHFIQGLVAVFQDEYYLVAKSGLTVHLDYTGVGLDAPDRRRHRRRAQGSALFSGKMWARVVGVILASDQPAGELRVHRGVPVLVRHRDRHGRLHHPGADRARPGDQVLRSGGRPRFRGRLARR